MAIDLPVEAVVQLMHNDLHTNWHDYRKRFLRRKPLDQERLNLVQERVRVLKQQDSDKAAAGNSI